MGRYYFKIHHLARVFEMEPMTYGEYAKRFGKKFDWANTSHIESANGYVKRLRDIPDVDWVDKEIFDECYVSCDRMPFSLALDLLKEGCCVTRKSWSSKQMVIAYQKGYPDGIPCNKQTADTWGMQEGDLFKCNPYLQIRQADGSHSMWTPSMDDLMAEDWMLLEEA